MLNRPVMNGFNLQDHLSAAGFNIPNVFMTAHEVDRVRTKVMEKGAVAFL